MQTLLRLLLILAALAAGHAARATPIGFDELADGTAVAGQYAGLDVQFEHATVLTAGISLNEIEFPPHSGANAIFDDGGPMVLRFTLPVRSFGAWFTYQTRLELVAYDPADAVIGLLSSSFDSNLALSGDPGSTANEWISFDALHGISRIVISGDPAGGSFVADDIAFSIPEPSSAALVALALATMALAVALRRGVRAKAWLMALGCALPWLAQAQEVAQPVIGPAVLDASASVQPVPITITASITDPAGTLLPNSVNLLYVRPDGQAEIVGTLNDAGIGGDAVARDGIFSATFWSNTYPFNRFGAGAGLVPLRVSAAYRGVLQRKLSPLARLELVEPGLPDDIRPSNIANAVWDSSRQREVIRNEVLFMAAPGTPASVLRQAAKTVGGRLVGLLPGGDVNTWQLEVDCSSAACVQARVEQLEAMPLLEGAGPNTVGTLAGVPKPNDPRFDEQYALANVQARKAWTISTGAHPHSPNAIPARRIAIVDSGVDDQHPDLKDKLILGKNYAVDPPNRQPKDNLGHGTHVAGIAAASTANGVGIAGMCWTCPIVVVKVIDGAEDPKLRTTALQVAAGVRDAVSRQAQVINLSLQHFDRDEDIARQIHNANRAGALVVAAAGNDGSNALSYPGAYEDSEVFVHRILVHSYAPRLLTVGATDAAHHRASFSNHGNWVELYAPGDQVLSTLPGSTYDKLDGTSMAAPLVSGVAALLSSGRPGFDPQVVRTALTTSAVDTGHVDPNGLPIRELDAFGAVFQGMASACFRCPEAPDVRIAGSTVYMGQTAPGDQTRSVHGVSVPLRPAGPKNRYVIDFAYDLLTFDSYVKPSGPGTGYFDSFSISLSSTPYYTLKLADPLATQADFTPTFVFGGTQRGGNARTGWQQLSLPVTARATSYLNAVLDTATLPDSDRANWSAGTFQVLDITPE